MDLKLKMEKLNEQLDKEIERPFKHITSSPGKNIRSDYTKALNHWVKIPEDKLGIINRIVHNLHNVSLLLDDIDDSALLRRGIPCAHTIFGFANTVNACDFMLYRTLETIAVYDHPQAVNAYLETLLSALTGQGLEIYWRDSFTCPTEDEYLFMVLKKTGCIFLGAMKVMKLFSDNKIDFTTFANCAGTYFQIQDDYKNLTSQEVFDSKGYCEDLTEGKFSFPIIHTINNFPEEGKIVKDILRQRTTDIELKKYCLSLIEKCGSLEYTKQKLKSLEKTIREEVEKLGENPYIEKFLQRMYLLSNQ